MVRAHGRRVRDAGLVGVISALWIRKVQRPDRFKGSHLGEADLILALIAGIVTTLLLWHASRIALDLNEWPAGWSPISNGLSNLFGGGDATEVLERTFVWAHILLVLGFLAYLPHSKHLPHRDGGRQRVVREDARRGRLEPLRLRRRGRGRAPVRVGDRRRHDLEADDRHDVLHRVRALPGRVPGIRHGEGALPEAADHGASRPAVRGRPEAPRCDARRRGLRANGPRRQRGDLRRRLGLRHLWCLRARMPRGDRARRSHRRPSSATRDGRGKSTHGGRDDVARPRAHVESVGKGPDREGGLDGRPRRASAATG